MGNATKRTRMLLEAPIVPTLLRLTAPNILNLVAIAGLITFDGLFVGRLGADALVGVSLVFPFVMFVQHTAASGLGGAVSSAIARALGAGDRARADALAAHAFVIALALGALVAALMLPLGPLVYRAMGGADATLAAALGYSAVALGGAASVSVLNILANVVRGTGAMTLPSGVLMGAVLLHAAISPVLIFGLGLGAAGAGWGLVISFTIGSAYLFLHLRKSDGPVRLTLRVPYRRELFREILRVGVPGIVNTAINNLAVILLTAVAGHLGKATALGYAIGARLEYIMLPLAFGFGAAMVAMVGTNWGARQYERARCIGWTGALCVAAVCGAAGLFFAAFPALWMGLYTSDEEVVRLGTLYLRTVGPAYLLYGLALGLYAAMQGIGSVNAAVLANALRLLIATLGGLAAATLLGAGALGMFLAVAAAFVANAAINVYAFGSTGRQPGGRRSILSGHPILPCFRRANLRSK